MPKVIGCRIRCFACDVVFKRERVIGYNIMLPIRNRHQRTGPTQRPQSLRHALFVAFHYPPEASSSGVLRTLKYTRYLREFGWRVSVITLDPSAYTVLDPRLEQEIPSGTRVLRTRFLNTKRDLSIRGIYPALLALPDVWIGWMPWAAAAGRRVIGSDPVDLIYSTSPHATAHLVACRLAAISAKPWVTDFRDPWIEDPPEPGAPNGLIYRTVNRRLESLVVKRSDAIVTSTTYMRDLMRNRYPDEPEAKIRAIFNGYDEADFADMHMRPSSRSSRLRIIHMGSIHAAFRDPCPLFAALGRMLGRMQLTASELEIQFIGGGPYGDAPQMQAAIEVAGLSGRVSFLPRVPYEESLRQLSGADLLLLLQASDDTAGLVPAKLYEYLRAQKPTLALVKTGAITEVIAETGGGWTADPSDAASLDLALAEIVHAWRADRLGTHCADLDALRRFDRRALTAELAAVFDGVCARKRA